MIDLQVENTIFMPLRFSSLRTLLRRYALRVTLFTNTLN